MLRCCYGHFVHKMQPDVHNIETLGHYKGHITGVNYWILYVALVIENDEREGVIFDDLKKITDVDPDYIQFGSVEWFWDSTLTPMQSGWSRREENARTA